MAYYIFKGSMTYEEKASRHDWLSNICSYNVEQFEDSS